MGVNKPAAEPLVNCRVTNALSAFPLHCLVSIMTTNTNNNTVSMKVQDTLPLLLRMLDPEELAEYNDMTPTALDHLAHYANSVDNTSFQMGDSSPSVHIISKECVRVRHGQIHGTHLDAEISWIVESQSTLLH